MRVLIIEDEDLAVKKLRKAILALDPDIEIRGVTDSIQSSVNWLRQHPAPDLIFMDIELADGQSFEIFNRIEVTSPIIFVTSYDEFALQAFKVNSVDYLLKPVQREELEASLQKFRKSQLLTASSLPVESLIRELQSKLQPKSYRTRFLVKHAQKLVSIEVKDIAYFFSEERLVFFKTTDNRRMLVDYLLDDLQEMMDPKHFFRINRSMLISSKSIAKIDDYFGSRLILQLKPALEKEVLVSREKVSGFKVWLGK